MKARSNESLEQGYTTILSLLKGIKHFSGNLNLAPPPAGLKL